jgi:hypothetical protein
MRGEDVIKASAPTIHTKESALMSFNEHEEDLILPNDYEEGQDYHLPSDDEEDDFQEEKEDISSNEDSTPSEESEEEKMFRIRFNHEDLEIPHSEAIELIQKGKNYEKISSRLEAIEADPRLSFVERLAEENDMSVEEFLSEWEEQRQQSQLEELIANNIPEELAIEIMEARQDREERRREKAEAEAKAKEESEFNEFFSQFELLNGRPYQPGKDIVPAEVWEAQAQGVPLKYAYLQHFNTELSNKVKILEQNQTNSTRSPVGSTTQFGTKNKEVSDPFLEGFMSEL